MISDIKRRISHHLVNYAGWQTGRKIVEIESDDWGSIRMPSREAYQKLYDNGVAVNQSAYCKYDSLASEEDLSMLFELLSQFKDSKGNHPVITANSVVTNPDFNKIRESGFREYHCENITDTFKRYPRHERCFELWKEGMNAALFHPQSHGKEHLNAQYWLNLLRNNSFDFALAFENNFWGLSSDVYPEMQRSVQASFDMEDVEDLEFHENNIRQGLQLFEEIFGYRSKSFIANNYIWSCELNKTLREEGVKYLQGMKYQKLPILKMNNRKMIRHHIGEKNEFGQFYLIRNCSFEPSLKQPGMNYIEDCLKGISTAFLWKKPAIISIHRINFVGFLNVSNRDQNLKLFHDLLKIILKKWPEVEFITSDQLGELIEEDKAE